jgi:hypothetical protein
MPRDIYRLDQIRCRVVRDRDNPYKRARLGVSRPFALSRILDSVGAAADGLLRPHADFIIDGLLRGLGNDIHPHAQHYGEIPQGWIGVRQTEHALNLLEDSAGLSSETIRTLRAYNARWLLANATELKTSRDGPILLDGIHSKVSLLPVDVSTVYLDYPQACLLVRRALSNLAFPPRIHAELERLFLTLVARESAKTLHFILGHQLLEMFEDRRERFLRELNYELWRPMCAAVAKLYVNLLSHRESSGHKSLERVGMLERFEAILTEVEIFRGLNGETYDKLTVDTRGVFAAVRWHVANRDLTATLVEKTMPRNVHQPRRVNQRQRTVALLVIRRAHQTVTWYAAPYRAIKDLLRVQHGVGGDDGDVADLRVKWENTMRRIRRDAVRADADDLVFGVWVSANPPYDCADKYTFEIELLDRGQNEALYRFVFSHRD